MDTAVRVPLSERVNLRMIAFFAVIALLVGFPVYSFVHEQITGGVTDAGGGFKEVDLKALGNFMFDAQGGSINDVPQKWRALDGQKVVLVGEMFAPNEASDNVRRFELVYSIAKCCFGGPPKVQERVFCEVPKSEGVEFVQGLARVTGVLHVEPKKDNGAVTSLYRLDVQSVGQVQ
jgi:hypothetical protein